MQQIWQLNSEQPCPDDLALYATELSVRPEKLQEYRAAYDRKEHVLHDPIYVTWKTYKDKCAMQQNDAMKEQTHTSVSRLMPNSSTPVTAPVLDTAVMQLEASKTTHQTHVRHTHTQPFYGSVEFVRENPGEPVPEETFTHYSHHSHQSSLSAFSI